MQRLLTDPDARAAMGTAARARVVRDYALAQSLERLDRHYDGLTRRQERAA
jgi:hypothetical protein